MAHLAVQIEHRDLVRVLEIERESKGDLDLTTMRRDQRKAVVEVFVVDGPERRMVASFVVPSLPNLENRRPLIQLKGAVIDGNARLQLFVERRLVETKNVDVRRFLPRKSLLPVLVGVLVALLLFGGVYFLFFREKAIEAPASTAPATTTPASRPPSTPPATTIPAPSTDPAAPASRAADPPANGEPAPAPGSDPAPGSTPAPGSDTAPATNGRAAGSSTPPATSRTPEVAPAAPAPEVSSPQGNLAQEARYTVYFSPNSAVLTPAAQEELRRVQRALEREPVDRLRIVGHTALAGTEAGRIELSWDRARAVQAFLSEGGLAVVDQAQILGRGGEDPVVRDLERQQRNRRVEIYFDG